MYVHWVWFRSSVVYFNDSYSLYFCIQGATERIKASCCISQSWTPFIPYFILVFLPTLPSAFSFNRHLRQDGPKLLPFKFFVVSEPLFFIYGIQRMPNIGSEVLFFNWNENFIAHELFLDRFWRMDLFIHRDESLKTEQNTFPSSCPSLISGIFLSCLIMIFPSVRHALYLMLKLWYFCRSSFSYIIFLWFCMKARSISI